MDKAQFIIRDQLDALRSLLHVTTKIIDEAKKLLVDEENINSFERLMKERDELFDRFKSLEIQYLSLVSDMAESVCTMETKEEKRHLVKRLLQLDMEAAEAIGRVRDNAKGALQRSEQRVRDVQKYTDPFQSPHSIFFDKKY